MSTATLAPDAPGYRRVLLVDDDELCRHRLARALTRHGFVVVAAGSVAAALDQLHHGRFDAIVTETCLRDGTGLDVFQAARARHASTSIVFLGSDPELPARIGSVRYCCRAHGPDALSAAVVAACGASDRRPVGPAAAMRRPRVSRQSRLVPHVAPAAQVTSP